MVWPRAARKVQSAGRMARFDQLVARNLGCSRTDARQLLVSGALTMDPGATADVPADNRPVAVRIHGRPVVLYDTFHLLMNKPAGVVTALRDRLHPTAYDLLRGAPLMKELRAVGRLDLDTTGALIWTTDGNWIQRLIHPKHRIPRTYQAALARPFADLPADLVLEDGHRPHIVHIARLDDPSDLHPSLARPAGTAAHATITIVGGAYHEVRRIFAALGSHVLALCRVSFGRIQLPADLDPGTYRPIRMDDV